MNFLKKIFSQKAEPSSSGEPFWANNFTPNAYKQFQHLVSAYFDQQGQQYKIVNGTVFLLDQDCSYSLQNIAQKCYQSKPDTWPALIQAHFHVLNNVPLDPAASPETGSDFDKIAPCLAVRIWPDGTLESTGPENLVYQQDLIGTISVLVLDRPDSIQAVYPKMVAQWGKSKEALFEIGLSNLRTQCQPERHLKELSQGVKVHVLTSDSVFTTTYALLIDKFPDLMGAHGTLFGIPHRQVMICYPIQGIQIIQAIQQLIPIIGQLFQEGPGSVSPHLYWYSQGKYSAIIFDAQKKSVYIPPEFTEVLNQIAEQAKNQTA